MVAETILLPRRTLLGGAAALLASPALAIPRNRDPLDGVSAASESVQMSLASLDGSHQLVARLCRYPGANRAWLWVQLLTPDGFFACYDHHLPTGPEKTRLEAKDVLYAVGGMTARRTGERLKPTSCHADVRARLAATGAPREGEGHIPFHAKLSLNPTRRYAGLLPGRSELFGLGEMDIELNGRRFRGPATGQFHEQPQETPRFNQPYSYASLWGPDSSITAIAGASGGGGYRATDSGSTDFRGARFTETGDSRTLTLGAPGASLEVTAEVRARQQIPIFSGLWRGQFVEAKAGGETLYGVFVDFDMPSAPAAQT
ncbi:hypothetical protein FJQ54_10810 [Sandaracinobacter neustonicus]|uniref:Uncharacterized protein n=1 Tax=Sandaracinobacter neustonicus TaxID=1715348 RepID=A0A501XIJ6_9SPHN|nr:hypothetical protein [Sandaracinobacter neustonicus]TPE60488.1 hypothetical protein FJQ54_10810 [Sandaracinobacter neustonicus]